MRLAIHRGVLCLRWGVWTPREPERASRRKGTLGDLIQEGYGFTASQPLPGPLSLWPLSLQDPEEHQRQLKKKQNNRAAAQRSRQKHTNKADALHQVGDAFLPIPDVTYLARPPLRCPAYEQFPLHCRMCQGA